MIEVGNTADQMPTTPDYPFLVRARDNRQFVIATGRTSGFSLGGCTAFTYSEKWIEFDDTRVWEIIPVGTTITLTVK